MRIILSNLELLRADIEKTIDASDSRKHWQGLVYGTLVHWLGIIYDEGSGYTKDLETALDVSRGHVARLTEYNSRLQERIAALERQLKEQLDD